MLKIFSISNRNVLKIIFNALKAIILKYKTFYTVNQNAVAVFPVLLLDFNSMLEFATKDANFSIKAIYSNFFW